MFKLIFPLINPDILLTFIDGIDTITLFTLVNKNKKKGFSTEFKRNLQKKLEKYFFIEKIQSEIISLLKYAGGFTR